MNTNAFQGGCVHCGMVHSTTCPRIKAIEYFENGTVRRIEFHGQHASPAVAPGPFIATTIAQ